MFSRQTAARATPLAAAATVFALGFVGASLVYPHFGSVGVVRALFVDNAFLVVAAIGASFVIFAGGIDLSVGSVIAVAAVAGAALITRGMHPALAFAITLASCALFGLVQGLVIQHFELPAFLVTLAGMFLARAGAFSISQTSLAIEHPFVTGTLSQSLALTFATGSGRVSIPIYVTASLAAVAVAWYVLTQTPRGRAVYAVGDDERAAALMGVDVARTRVLVYGAAGMCSGLAGVVLCLYQQSGDPAGCKGLELDAIAAVIIGGASIRGGSGSIVGTFIGVMVLGLIQSVITFQGDLSSWWTRIVAASLVLLFLAGHRLLARRFEKVRPAIDLH